MIATVGDTGTQFVGKNRAEISERIAEWLERMWQSTGNSAWLLAECSDEDGTFVVEIDRSTDDE